MDKIKAQAIVDTLSKYYDDTPQLKFNTCYELLVAVILSAQCTDERVNKVTAELFKNYSTPDKMVTLSQDELGKMIYSCGLYKNKAKHILQTSRDILDRFNGQVPSSLQDLRTLAGVGRKTANVVYSVGFKGDAIAVDTHVFRVANRIGLANSTNVLGTENDLMQILDKSVWSRAHHYIIFHGRAVCKAQNPYCKNCQLNHLCEKNIKNKK